MFCCPRCFDDATLDKIFQRRTERFGECLYCGSEDVRILAPPELLDDFEAVLGAYTESSKGEGKPFAELLREDWQLFPLLQPHALRSLLDDILGSGFHAKRFLIDRSAGETKAAHWGLFREELMRRNRFFPEGNVDLEAWLKLLYHLRMVSLR